MGHAGLDPQMALEFVPTLIYWVAWFLAGLALLGLSAYVVFLFLEIFSSQPRSKTRTAKLPQPAGCAPMAEESLHRSAAEAPTLAAPERLDEETGRMSGCPHDPQMRTTTSARVTLVPEGPLEFES